MNHSKEAALAYQYPIMEHFYTLQGEGAFMGQAAYFIRLGGCDVACHWCDVKESWDASIHPQLSVEQIVQAAKTHPARIAVITGGEPSLYDLNPLTIALQAAGFRTHIETSGSSPLTGKLDWVTLSPKKFKPALQENMHWVNELKIVVYNKSDFDWAEQHAALVSRDCKLYLQPEWSKQDEMTPLIIDYIMAHPQWQLSLQSHKYLNIP